MTVYNRSPKVRPFLALAQEAGPGGGAQAGWDTREQKACDACVDGCDYLCDRPNGGGLGGDCIGLFCPTRCDQCVLSCFQTCGKCIPSRF